TRWSELQQSEPQVSPSKYGGSNDPESVLQRGLDAIPIKSKRRSATLSRDNIRRLLNIGLLNERPHLLRRRRKGLGITALHKLLELLRDAMLSNHRKPVPLALKSSRTSVRLVELLLQLLKIRLRSILNL